MGIVYKDEELNGVVKEYSSFVKSMKREGDVLHVVTLEEEQHRVQITSAGWSVDGTEQIFETSEALLMSISPEFAKLWHSELFSKLAKLQ
ncbi:hypothetical protein TRVA0_052S01090 [Trichomonascus vanleenenianus]|uniref:uncharacterized protein n=1 Tax=Trichomonascus vanleenenianus TaxID=2268995 RepID=UPI003ECA0CC7